MWGIWAIVESQASGAFDQKMTRLHDGEFDQISLKTLNAQELYDKNQ